MRGNLETIVGAMFAGKTSELLKRILWIEHQGKKVLVFKPLVDNRYSNKNIVTHNNLSHECYSIINWEKANNDYKLTKENLDTLFLDEVQFMETNSTLKNVEKLLASGINVVVCRIGPRFTR